MTLPIPKVKPNYLLMLVPYMVLVAIGWWVPNDLLERSSSLREFSNFMASFIPQIDRATVLGGVSGQTNRAIYACLWPLVIACMPVMFVSRFRHVQRFGFEANQQCFPLWQVIALIVAAPLLAWQCFYLYWFDTSLRIVHFAFVNRFGAALMAPGFAFAPGFVMFGVFMLCWGLFTRRIAIGSNRRSPNPSINTDAAR